MGLIAYNTTVWYSDVGADTWTHVVGASSVEFPELSVNDVKDINYETANKTVGYIAGWKDAGTFNIESDYSATNYVLLAGLVGNKKDWKIVAADGGTAIMTGYINKNGAPLPNEDKIVVKSTVRVCTLPTLSVS